MPKSIAVFGAGPALGQAVARRYAREGYTVTLVARRPEPLERMTAELTRAGAAAHAVAADLSDTDGVPGLADRVRTAAGDPDVLYYGPTITGVLPAAELTPQRLEPFLRVPVYTLIALVREFLPHMIRQHDGAVLLAAGASAVQGLPNFSGPGPALAAQRNYVQSLHAELAPDGVYAGGLYIGATIEHSAFHARVEADAAAGRPAQVRGPLVSPGYLADLLWTMHQVSRPREALYPEDVFSR
jgi:short-subunit dehydrogenase